MLYLDPFWLFLFDADILHIGALRDEDDVVRIALLCGLSVVLRELSGKVVFGCEVFEGDVFVLA